MEEMNQKTEIKKKRNDPWVKVGISKSANQKIEKFLDKVNQNLIGRKISKQDITSFSIEKLDENQLQELKTKFRDIRAELKQYIDTLENIESAEELLNRLKEKISS